MARVVYSNFTGGEVTPALSSRYDLKKFGSFLQCCENFIPNLHGDVERRPGTAFVGGLGVFKCVLLPFSFNTEQENNFVLIFGYAGSYIGVASATQIINAMAMRNPYAVDDVYDISYAQVGDVLYLAHKKYPLKKITRSGVGPNYIWGIQNVSFNRSLSAPSAPIVTWHSGDAETGAEEYDLSYVITAVDADGIESVASPVGSCVGRYPTDWVQGDYVSLSWDKVAGAVEYNIYRESAGYYGFIGTTDATERSRSRTRMYYGNLEGEEVYFSATVSRKVNQRRQRKNGPIETMLDTSEDMQVVANSAQKAFTFSDGATKYALVFVTRTTEYHLYTYNADAYLGGTSETSTVIDYFWAMITYTDAVAGSYSSYTTGDLGTDSNQPSGWINGWSTGWRVITSSFAFKDQNYEPNTALTPKTDWRPFDNGNNPATVCFHQQRMCLAGTRDNPAAFYMSRTGDYENFRKSSPSQDDDPVEYMLASGSIDDVKWMVSFGDLLIGTSGCEYQATSSGAAITNSDVQITAQTYWGSAALHPLILGQSILHCQRAGSHVRDLYYSWETGGYAGTDLSVLAPQEVETSPIKQWCCQQGVNTSVWAVREDGTLLCLTYMKEQNIFAWSRHKTDGQVVSIASISDGDNDVLMLMVKRAVRGQFSSYSLHLERMVSRFGPSDSIESAWYVDDGKMVIADSETTTFSGFSHLAGQKVVALADGAPVMDLTVSSSGQITLPFKAKVVICGRNFTSVLSPLPIETDTQAGSTLGKHRAYGKCTLRLNRSVGGKYAATQQGDLFNIEAWKSRTQYDIPFLPEKYDVACQPFSGDIDITLPSGQDTDTSIWLIQDRPMPFRVCAIAMDIDFGEN